MSYWYEAKKKDISHDDKDLNVWLEQDDAGNVYVAINLKTLKEYLEENGLLSQSDE